MFEQNYKNAMDKVAPDADTRDRILDKIILKEELKRRKNPAVPWRIAFACVACIAVILGIVFVPRNNFKLTGTGTSQTLRVSKSYAEIYKLIKPKRTAQNFFENFGVDDAEDYYVIEEETVYEGVADSQNTDTSADGAAPGGMKDEGTNSSDDYEQNEYSNTTEQVEGVAEADIVKTDGKYIYYLLSGKLYITKADGQNSVLISKTTVKDNEYDVYSDMFLKDDRLIILQTDTYDYKSNFVAIIIYDISDPKSPELVTTSKQEGWYGSSRMVGDYVYLISNCDINIREIEKDDPATFVPTTETNGVCEPVPADSIYRYEQDSYTNQYTVIGAYNCKDGTLCDTASLLGGTDNVYCSRGNIILANGKSKNDNDIEGSYSVYSTVVSRLEIKGGEIEYKASGEVEGMLENQFFIDEHNGYFRFVTTDTVATQTKQKFENTNSEIISYSSETSARLAVLDQELKKVGEITDLARGERVYSVRFMGDIAYFVTFRQTDPLFSADLSDPKNPKILGQLKIPGFSEYMYPYGEGLLLGFGMDANEKTGRTTHLKLSMFDITDPSNVTEQDKTVVDGYNYSTALDNHKSMLVSPTKNLIGFVAYDNYGDIRYMIYEHRDTAFGRLAVLQLPHESAEAYKYYDAIRGLFINDSFYLVSDKGVQVFDMSTFLQINFVEF